jgi:6-pyruvoyltetrahydropterin/6-carboxytetrahydropterin synthase
MFEISTESTFSAAHHLNCHEGPCEKVHGHNWLVRAVVRCETLNKIGIGIDFKTLKSILCEILKELDHTDLNVLFEKQGLNPSSENCARYVFEQLEVLLKKQPCMVVRVEVTETPGNTAAYYR